MSVEAIDVGSDLLFLRRHVPGVPDLRLRHIASQLTEGALLFREGAQLLRCGTQVSLGEAEVLVLELDVREIEPASRLEQAISTFVESTNQQPRPFIWTKTADQILDSVARFCMRTSDSGH